jgi:hypothetical protein
MRSRKGLLNPEDEPSPLLALKSETVARAAAIRAAQAKMTVTVATTSVTHVDDSTTMYRLAVPVSTSTYEVTGLTAPSFTDPPLLATQTPDRVALLAKSDLVPVISLTGSDDLAYHETPSGVALQRRLLERTVHTYYNDALSGVLLVGSVGTRAIPYETRMAAFTPAMLGAVFTSSEIGDSTDDENTFLRDRGGYVLLDGLWWARSGRMGFDDAHFYLPVEAHDPFGNVASVEYDVRSLFATSTTDPVGNVVSASYDARLLATQKITDPNGNRTHAVFDTLGRVIEVYVMGKVGDTDGDVLPTGEEPGIPGQIIEYDEHAWVENRGPVSARVRVREVAGDAGSRMQESTVFSDGFGRELLTKTRCEPDPEDAETPRWIGTGRTVYNNKGLAVKKYEPYFSTSGGYDAETDDVLSMHGVTPVIHYDPMGRAVRTDMPDGTFTRVEFDAWSETHLDANDNVEGSAWAEARAELGSTDPRAIALTKALVHKNTPTIIHADALGRPVAVVALPATTTLEDPRCVTRVELDVHVQNALHGPTGPGLRESADDWNAAHGVHR